MLIDWLTLRTNITDIEEQSIYALMPYLATLTVKNMNDEVIKTKLVIDIDQVRSDFMGMVWQITSNGKDKYLNIGASPAFLKNGNNLFGSFDYQECKQIVIDYASKVFKKTLLISSNWQPRRIDVTQNYNLESHTQVKDALHILRASDGIRQKATVKGDSVYFGETSHYRGGKCYDKSTQAIALNQKAIKQNKPIPYSNEQLYLMESILRLELKLGRQFFDEHTNENDLTQQFLTEQHNEFFEKFIGNYEVTDMDTLYKRLIETAPTIGRAKSAYDTYLRIKQLGYVTASQTMPVSTFRRHRQYLYQAGLCHSDLTTAQIIPLRKRKLTLEPVNSWEHLKELKQKVA